MSRRYSHSSSHSHYHSYSRPHSTHHTVHHVYHVQVPYQCGNCQRSAIGLDRIPQCTACRVQLCNDCNNHEFCPEHWNALSPEDQDEIMRIERKPLGKPSPWSICLVIVAVLAILPFSMLPILVDDFNIAVHMPIMMGGIFGVMFLIIIVSVAATKRMKHKVYERQQWIDDLLARYNFKPKTPQMSNMNIFQSVNQNSVSNMPINKQPSSSETYRPSSGTSTQANQQRSEERRIGKECRSRWTP